jgi:hypothetical protein
MRKRDELNLELMQLLERETTAESLREQQLKMCGNEAERSKLERQFGVERAKASERIIQCSDRHDTVLRQEMTALGLTF